MPNDMPRGAQRIGSFEVEYPNGDKDYVALYQPHQGTSSITLLIDSFRNGSWDSALLMPDTVDTLRKALNKAHRERRSQ